MDNILSIVTLEYPEACTILAPIIHERLSRFEEHEMCGTADIAEMIMSREVQLKNRKEAMRLFYILTLLAKNELRGCVFEKADKNRKGEAIKRTGWRNGPLQPRLAPAPKPASVLLDVASLRETWPHLEETLAALHPGLRYATACDLIANQVHQILTTIPRDKPIDTMALAVRLLPSTCKVSHPAEYNRLFRILKDLARGQLKDCTSPGTPRKYMGRVAYPKLWHTGPLHSYDPLAKVTPSKNNSTPSTTEMVCQHCGSKLPSV